MSEAQRIAEAVAYDGYTNYHRARLQLEDGLQMVDQIRSYVVVERDDHYVVIYRNGFNAGMPTIYATVNKSTLDVCLN